MRLSEAQKRMLLLTLRNGQTVRPFGDGKDMGRLCRAWDRTAESLRDMGLLIVFSGQLTGELTDEGLRVAEKLVED